MGGKGLGYNLYERRGAGFRSFLFWLIYAPYQGLSRSIVSMLLLSNFGAARPSTPASRTTSWTDLGGTRASTGGAAHAAEQLCGEAGELQVNNPKLAGVFNMGGAAVANYVSILEREG